MQIPHFLSHKNAERDKIIRHKSYPEQDSNLHTSRHSHLKRARLPFRHPGLTFTKIVKKHKRHTTIKGKRVSFHQIKSFHHLNPPFHHSFI